MQWWQILVTSFILLFSFLPLFSENRLKYRSLAIGGGLLYLWSFLALPWVSLDLECILNDLTGGFLPLLEGLGIATEFFIDIFGSDNVQQILSSGTLLAQYAFHPSGAMLYWYFPASHTNLFFYTLLTLPAFYALFVMVAGMLSFLPFFRGFHKFIAGLLSFLGLLVITPLLIVGLPLLDSWGTTGEFGPGIIAWLLNAKLGAGLWLALLLALPMMIASGERIYAGVEDESSLGYASGESGEGNPIVAFALGVPGKIWMSIGAILLLVSFFFLPWINYDPIEYQTNLAELEKLPEAISGPLCALQSLPADCNLYQEPWPFLDAQVQEVMDELAQGSKFTGASIFIRPFGSNLAWQIAMIGMLALAVINLVWAVIFQTQFDNSDDVPVNTFIVSISAALMLVFFLASLFYFPKIEVWGTTRHYQLGLLMKTALADVGVGATLGLLAGFLMMLGAFREILEFLNANSLRIVAVGMLAGVLGGIILSVMALVTASASEVCAIDGVVAPPTPTPTPTPNYPPTPFNFIPEDEPVYVCPGGSGYTNWNAVIPPAPQNTDILMAFDRSESMNETISAAKEQAIQLMDTLAGSMDSVQFGVVSFEDEFLAPYTLSQHLTNNYAMVETAIGNLQTEERSADEAFLRVIYEAYSDPSVGWRQNSQKYLVFFTDEPVRETESGIDRELGTSDDLDASTIVEMLADMNVQVVIFMPTTDFNLEWENLVLSNISGRIALLENPSEFAAVVNNVITELSMQIDTLTIGAEPDEYVSWVSAPIQPGFEVGAEERDVLFNVQFSIPEGYYMPGTYPITISALGDGVPYDTRIVNIIIPDDCPRP